MPYIANKRNMANITNVHYFDSAAGAWSANLMAAALPFAMLPNPVAAGDVVVFGIDTSLVDSGPFCSLVFDIGVAMANVTTAVWRYSTAGADPTVNWLAIPTLQDNTNADGDMTGQIFDTVGINSVHWSQPSAWTVQNPTVGAVALGITGYWVCVHITVVGAATPPIQQNRDIYSITWPYIEVQLGEVGGDIPALLQMKLRGQSQNAAGSTLNVQQTFMVGLRSLNRGSNFTAYINLADEQNPIGITVVLGGFTVFSTDVTTPTGRVALFSPVGAIASAMRVRVTFSDALAQEYSGIYRCYVRVDETAGVADYNISLGARNPSGGSNYWQTSEVLYDYAALGLLDLGMVTLPGVGGFDADEVGGFMLELYSDSTAAGSVEFMDLILIPIDEWAGHFVEIGTNPRFTSKDYYLLIDSVAHPKRNIRCALFESATDLFESPQMTIAADKAILQANAAQRLWFVASATNGDVTAVHEFAATIQAYKNQRYFSMRGGR